MVRPLIGTKNQEPSESLLKQIKMCDLRRKIPCYRFIIPLLTRVVSLSLLLWFNLMTEVVKN